MAKHIFPPEGTVPITELSIALIGKRLGQRRWKSPFSSKPDDKRDKRTLKALSDSEQTLLEALQSSRLIAHAFREATESLCPIPKTYWLEDAAAVTLQGRMFDLAPGRTFQAELDEAPVVVKVPEAITWLKQQGILDTDPFFPDSLRIEVAPRGTPRKPQYERQRFLDEAVARLHDEGGLTGNQASFEEDMRVWYEDNIGEPPSKRTIRYYVRAALHRFQEENARGMTF